MFETVPKELLPADLLERRAVEAWRRVWPDWCEPTRLEVLKRKRKSAVYRLAGAGPDGSAVIAKRCPRTTAAVERTIYEEFLPRLPLPSLRCHGSVEEPDGEYCWVFLEDAGEHQFSPANEADRALAGRWLGFVHGAPFPAGLHEQLPDRGPGHYARLLRTARATVLQHVADSALPAEDRSILRSVAAQCDLAESHWDELETFCAQLPPMLVHGDLVVKNVCVRTTPAGPALLVFDWENAGWGVPGTDLCQFTGRTVSPNLDVYCAERARSLPLLELREARRLACFGSVLRVLDDVAWAVLGMEFDNSYRYLAKPMSYLRSYEPMLAKALEAAGWRQ